MASPIITFTDVSSANLSSISFNVVDAGSTGATTNILVWNNKGGSGPVSDAVQTTITTKSFNGLDTGDNAANGQEVVSNQMLHIKCTSQGDASFTAVGGPTTAPIGSAAGGTGVIKGTAGGDSSAVSLYILAPANVTAGPAQFLIRVSYLYS